MKLLLFSTLSEEEAIVLVAVRIKSYCFCSSEKTKLLFLYQQEEEIIVFPIVRRRSYYFCSNEKKKLFFVAGRRRNYHFCSSGKKKLLFSMQCEETIVLYQWEEGPIVFSE
jgi:hypothetical protein